MASVLESRPAGPGLATTTVLADSDSAEGVAGAAADAAIAEPAAATGTFEESWSLSNQ